MKVPDSREAGKKIGDRHVRTAVCEMDNQQGPAVEHRELFSMLWGCLGGRGVWGRMDKCTCYG